MDDATLIARLDKAIAVSKDRNGDMMYLGEPDQILVDAKARIEALTAERDAAIAAERERCARVAERLNDDFGLTERQAAQIIASEIRKGE